MAFEGMDINEVISLGNQLKSQGNSIGDIVRAIDGIVNSMESAWVGPDATEFNGWWQSQHKPALLAAEEAVSGLGQSALNNAAAQQTASQA